MEIAKISKYSGVLIFCVFDYLLFWLSSYNIFPYDLSNVDTIYADKIHIGNFMLDFPVGSLKSFTDLNKLI